MNKTTATVRELRTNFRSLKRKLEECGEVIITDKGVPRFLLTSLPPAPAKRCRPMPNYWARLISQQPKPMSVEAARELHEENRGDH